MIDYTPHLARAKELLERGRIFGERGLLSFAENALRDDAEHGDEETTRVHTEARILGHAGYMWALKKKGLSLRTWLELHIAAWCQLSAAYQALASSITTRLRRNGITEAIYWWKRRLPQGIGIDYAPRFMLLLEIAVMQGQEGAYLAESILEAVQGREERFDVETRLSLAISAVEFYRVRVERCRKWPFSSNSIKRNSEQVLRWERLREKYFHEATQLAVAKRQRARALILTGRGGELRKEPDNYGLFTKRLTAYLCFYT